MPTLHIGVCLFGQNPSTSAIYVLYSTSQKSYDMISIFNLSCSKEVREFEYSKRDMHALISNR